ncbi:MAG: hypothetical protein IIA59_09490 [Candidatus Marinimicrobia bacterium]|nr:hypothetical protein [Candidatus Neomarinimicrobiota bacterium]
MARLCIATALILLAPLAGQKGFTTHVMSLIGWQESSLREALGNASITSFGEVQGTLVDMVLTGAGGDFISLSSDGDNFYLCHYDFNGTKKWLISHPLGRTTRKVERLVVSEDGTAIVVQGGDQAIESYANWIFDGTGSLLFSDVDASGIYYPSPNGDHFVRDSDDLDGQLEIYQRDGSPIEFNLPDRFASGKVKERFVDDDHLLIYQERVVDSSRIAELILVDFPSLEIKWSHQFDHRMGGGNFNLDYSAISPKYICTIMPGSGLTVFSRRSGERLWGYADIGWWRDLAFDEEGEILYFLTEGKFLNIIDIKAKLVTDSYRLFDYGNAYGWSHLTFTTHGLVFTNSHLVAHYTDANGVKKRTVGMGSVLVRTNNQNQVQEVMVIPGYALYQTFRDRKEFYLIKQSGKKIERLNLR